MQIRFTNLVKRSGYPETLVLWGDPKKNSALQEAVRENRVLTVIQKPTGTKKDFGQIGFHQQPFATYLIFPKRLPEDDARVVGINYATIEEPVPKRSERAPRATAPPPVTKTSPAEIAFEVTVKRTAVEIRELIIPARNKSEAKQKALESVRQEGFHANAAKIKDEIISA